MGTPTLKGAGVKAGLPRMAWVSQETPWMFREWPWVSRWVELMLRLHQQCPRVVKLVMGLHHVSQGSNQGEFQDDGSSVWASPCEFQW